jgi:hypothetical protein
MSAVSQETTEQELMNGAWSFWLGLTYMSYEGNYYISRKEGGIEQKVKHGKGVLKWDDGREYSGEFVNDKLHGLGIMSWPTGQKYEGTYVNNLRMASVNSPFQTVLYMKETGVRECAMVI